MTIHIFSRDKPSGYGTGMPNELKVKKGGGLSAVDRRDAPVNEDVWEVFRGSCVGPGDMDSSIAGCYAEVVAYERESSSRRV